MDVSSTVCVERPLATVMALIAICVGGGALAASARAECANEEIRRTEVYALKTPDCRAYEQVSPTDKNFSDAVSIVGLVQGALSGDGVTFFSVLPFPGVPGAAEFPTYLSTRGSEGWSTQGLLPPSAPGTAPFLVGMTEDLAYTILAAKEPALTPGATPGRYNRYIRDNATGSYQRLAGPGELHFAGATPDDSRILFEDEAKLLPAAAPEVPNLYEWDDGQLSVVGVLSNGKAPESGVAAGARSETYQQNTISTDGSRVFFTDAGTGQIYVRENGTTTVQVSASRRSVAEAEGPAYWRAATPDGRYAFFTSETKLTDDSTASPGRPDLYRFAVENEELIDLTSSDPEGANVLGTLGVSADGSYVYFVATGTLTGGAVEGSANLYEWHAGVNGNTTILVAGLDPSLDEANWRDFVNGGEGEGPAEGGKSSRVTPGGTRVLFSTFTPLKPGYDNAGHDELYLFDATLPVSPDNPACMSCNPSGRPAVDDAYLSHVGVSPPAPVSRNAFVTRNLSVDGNRAFFETEESLVPQDTNGTMDVYEWEDGSLYLISTGQSSDVSYFGDASTDGGDVFFFTRQALVSQDRDENADVYDARVDGGIAAQNPTPPPEPCENEACRGALGSPPTLTVPSSAMFSGVGNLAPPPEAKPKKHHKSKKHSRSHKRKHRRARRPTHAHSTAGRQRS